MEYSRAYQRNPCATFPSAQRYIEDTESGSEVQMLLLKLFNRNSVRARVMYAVQQALASSASRT
jgi:hypothetical protein